MILSKKQLGDKQFSVITSRHRNMPNELVIKICKDNILEGHCLGIGCSNCPLNNGTDHCDLTELHINNTLATHFSDLAEEYPELFI